MFHLEKNLNTINHAYIKRGMCECDIRSYASDPVYNLLISKYMTDELWNDLVTLINHKKKCGSYIILFFNAETYLDRLVKIFRELPTNNIKYNLYFASAPDISTYSEFIKNAVVENLWISTSKSDTNHLFDFVDYNIDLYLLSVVKNVRFTQVDYDYPRNLCQCFDSINLTFQFNLTLYCTRKLGEILPTIVNKILSVVPIDDFFAYDCDVEEYLNNIKSVDKMSITHSCNSIDTIQRCTSTFKSVSIKVDSISDDDYEEFYKFICHTRSECKLMIDFDASQIYEAFEYCHNRQLINDAIRECYNNDFWMTRLVDSVTNPDSATYLPNVSVNYPVGINFFELGLFTKITASDSFDIEILVDSYTGILTGSSHDNLIIYICINNHPGTNKKNLAIKCCGTELCKLFISHIEKYIYIDNLMFGNCDLRICNVVDIINNSNLCIGKLTFDKHVVRPSDIDIANKLFTVNKLVISGVSFCAGYYPSTNITVFKKFVHALCEAIDTVPQICFSFIKFDSCCPKLDSDTFTQIRTLQNNRSKDQRFKRCAFIVKD